MYIRPQIDISKHLIGRNFNHRSGIYLSPIKVTINNRKGNNSAYHQTREIHVRSVRIDYCRKEAEIQYDIPRSHTEGCASAGPIPYNTEDLS